MAGFSLWLASQAGRCWQVEALSPENFDQQTLRTALHVAVANDHAGVARILMRAGAGFDSNYGPMHTALRYDSADALRTLVEAKAIVNTCTSCGYFTAVGVDHRAVKCLQVLVMNKADLTLAGIGAETPVIAAAVEGLVGIVHLLLQAKANINTESRGGTPVLMASRYGHVDVVRLLLRAKADATRCTKYSNQSPLLVAAAGGHVAVVRCLLACAPALAAVKTWRVSFALHVWIPTDSTPLDVARLYRLNDVVLLLAAATANK